MRIKNIIFIISIPFYLSYLFLQHSGSADKPQRTNKISVDMISGAGAFLNSLKHGTQQKAQFEFDDKRRTKWTYLPGHREGVMRKELNESQKSAADNLLRQFLGQRGFEKSMGVIELEDILRQMSGQTGANPFRDPGKYYYAIYGTPSADNPWGWSLEGHHLSLNFTLLGNQLISSTPLFFGANPAEVPSGPAKGWRLLQDEEDLARELLKSMNNDQFSQAVFSQTAPADIITGSRTRIEMLEKEGIVASTMNEKQQALLFQLIGIYLNNFSEALARKKLETIRSDGLHHLRFAWAGFAEPGKPHYYRIQSRTLLIEYDNTQNNANHIHTVVRNPKNDFGFDILRNHYNEHKQDSDHSHR